MRTNWIYSSIVVLALACGQSNSSDHSRSLALIPQPKVINVSEGHFVINSKTTISSDTELACVQDLLVDLSNLLGKEFTLASSPLKSKDIYFNLDSSKAWEKEAYMINITKKLVTIRAGTKEGLCRGLQTLRQMISLTARESGLAEEVRLPVSRIVDAPKYEYRGVMLDIARHFFDKEDIMKFIDYANMYKYNHVHLHLTDDQGWRLEINSWPKLTEIGAQSAVDGDPGGFLTQEDYSEIIQYAADRHITIVPEIDVPGHTNAALASYPELNCDGKPRDIYEGIEVGFSSLCIDKELTYRFLDDVIRELALLTPGPYLHLGGDESHATDHEDYAIFMRRVEDIVTKYDKTMIAWEEVVGAGISNSVVVQHWNNQKHLDSALEKGFKVIFSPASFAYLDMKYDSTSPLGLHWAGYIMPKKAYDWNPSEFVDTDRQHQIIGVEAPLWTETTRSLADIEYMIFPRMTAIAEIGWSSSSHKDWTDMRRRISKHESFWKEKGINYFKIANTTID